jgi:protein kinase C substrate 80K-H
MAGPTRPVALRLRLPVVLVVVVVALLAAAPPGCDAKAAAATQAPRRVRGAAPDLAPRYAPGADGSWACLDGSAVLPSFSRVNDDFCDCPDGSDEPGTSACPSGTFYCANRGHESRALSSAFVDDGVCGER